MKLTQGHLEKVARLLGYDTAMVTKARVMLSRSDASPMEAGGALWADEARRIVALIEVAETARARIEALEAALRDVRTHLVDNHIVGKGGYTVERIDTALAAATEE